MATHELKTASRINWNAKVNAEGEYPGDENVKIGCLQRIADATERMAKNVETLERELKWWKDLAETRQHYLEKEKKRSAALRGVINRMKKSEKKF